MEKAFLSRFTFEILPLDHKCLRFAYCLAVVLICYREGDYNGAQVAFANQTKLDLSEACGIPSSC